MVAGPKDEIGCDVRCILACLEAVFKVSNVDKGAMRFFASEDFGMVQAKN